MKNIYKNYLVHEGNNALLPARHTDYSTIVLSTYEKIYVNRTPLEIIKESCYRDFASYEGRRDAIKYRTSFMNKLPIPISTPRQIYAFPTTSPKNMNCIWLFYNRIKDYEEIKDSNESHQSVVHFVDGSSLPLDISFHTLKRQYERTKHCIELYEMEEAYVYK